MLETFNIFKQELSKNKDLHVMTDDEITKMKDVLLQIATDVAKVCDENDIPYTLSGGTALGAVRHKGFIPWDDDLDINMESRYIKRFCDLFTERYADKYAISVPGESKGYYSTFYQIHKKGTLCREDKHTPDELCGIKVDIFPFYNTFDSFYMRAFHGLLSDAGSFLMSCMRMHLFKDEYIELAGDNPKAQKIIALKAAIGTIPALFKDKMATVVLEWFDICHDEESKYLTCPAGRAHFAGELRKREGFTKTKKAPFEGKSFRLPQDVKVYLTQLYGKDYMTLPPEEKREKHVVYELDFGD